MTQLMIKTVFKNVALSLIFFLFIFNSTFGQKINLTGKVVDSKNKQGLEDVYVQIKGSSLSTATNTLGEFSFSIEDKFPIILSFNYIGYTPQEISINSGDYITVALEEKRNDLEEILIVSGYTVQKKSEFSGAVANIGSKQLLTRPAVSFDQLLGGLAPGVDIIQPTNILNNTPVMRIRGINSITSGLFPLVVVDGVSLFTGYIGGAIGNNPLSDINPNDI